MLNKILLLLLKHMFGYKGILSALEVPALGSELAEIRR